MQPDSPHIALVNPWIHDFAAYDFWARPLGLLTLASLLRAGGYRVSYIDCLDRFHPAAPASDPLARHGRGPYLKTPLKKPDGLDDVPRTFSRYGIFPEWLRADLKASPPPDLILVTSLMTYWYPGVQETICVLKEVYPGTPVILGGVYATVCRHHARQTSGADQVVDGTEMRSILALIGGLTRFSATYSFEADIPDTRPYPAFDLQTAIGYIPLMTSTGCPYRCAYCASDYLYPRRQTRSPGSVVDEISFWHLDYGVRDFVFYDDALLVDANRHAVPMLREIAQKKWDLRFHTPNALHIREITALTARLMFEAGFETVRLGLETTVFENRETLDHKVTREEFHQAVNHLTAAGFSKNRIGAYLLVGLPGQSMRATADSIETVHKTGVTPIPAYYSPIPHTELWPRAVASSRYDLEADPIFSNNAILPCRQSPFSWSTVTRIKQMVQRS